MTRKHYEAIAKIIANTTQDMEMIDLLCVFFKKDNPNFNEKKFKDACGYVYGWDTPPDWDAIDRYIKGEGTTFILGG